MVLLPVVWLAGSLAASPEVNLKCVSGEVRWSRESGDAARTLTPGDGDAVVSEPFRFSAESGAKLEVTRGGFALRLTGPFEGTYRDAGDRPTVALTRVSSFALSLGEGATWVALGTSYAFEGEQVLVEGTLDESGEIRLTNRAGLPLSLYRDGRWVDSLPEGMRARMGAPPPVAAAPPSAPPATAPSGPAAPPRPTTQTMEWAGRTLEIPAGIAASVRGGRLVLEGSAGLAGAAVLRLDGEAYVLRSGGVVEIDADGNVVSVEGAVRRFHSSRAGLAQNPFARFLSPSAASTGVIFVSPAVP